MGFSLDGVNWDSILSAVAENTKNQILYRMPDISEGTVEVTADTKDSTDKDGALIKRSYTAKSVSVTLTNTHLVLGAYGGTTGSGKIVLSEDESETAPRMLLIDPTTEYTLPDEPHTGTLSVTPVYSNGGTGTGYTLAADSTATDTTFAYATSSRKLTLPTNIASDVSQILIKYEYTCTDGVIVENHADKFPKTVKLTLQGLYFDPCEKDVLRLGYIVFPSFQPSPETSFSMQNDSTFDYKGDAQSDYCAKKKRLYYMVFPANDIQEDE